MLFLLQGPDRVEDSGSSASCRSISDTPRDAVSILCRTKCFPKVFLYPDSWIANPVDVTVHGKSIDLLRLSLFDKLLRKEYTFASVLPSKPSARTTRSAAVEHFCSLMNKVFQKVLGLQLPSKKFVGRIKTALQQS